jgi:hypothetical protein
LKSNETKPTHVLALALSLPMRVLDQILTGTEQSLTQAGATRVCAQWSTSGAVGLTSVSAECQPDFTAVNAAEMSWLYRAGHPRKR